MILNPFHHTNRNVRSAEEFSSPVADRSNNSITSQSTVHTIEDSNSSRVQLDVSELSYLVKEELKIKRLLRNVNLHINSGEMCAIMGPNGSGKTTLLEIIGGKKEVGVYEGEILINREEKDNKQHLIAYIPQEDMHHPLLTIGETLEFSLGMNMKSNATKAEKEQRIFAIAEVLRLINIMNLQVGDENVTNAARKLLSIGVEMMKMPKILILDEPISFLLAEAGLDIVHCLRKVITNTRIGLLTVDRPSPDMLSNFDRLILLSSGRVIYSGPIDKIITHFDSIGYPYIPGNNPAEYVIQISGLNKKSPAVLQTEFEQSKFFTPPDTKEFASSGLSELNPLPNEVTPNHITQIVLLFKRSWKTIIRKKKYLALELIVNIGAGLLIGITFYGGGSKAGPYLIEDDIPSTALSDFTGILFTCYLYFFFYHIHAIAPLFSNLLIYKRELSNNMYSPIAYWLSSTLVLLPIQFLMYCAFMITLYPLCKFNYDTKHFFFFHVVMILTFLFGYYVYYCTITVIRNYRSVFIVIIPFFMLSRVYAGFSILISDIPAWLRWSTNLNYMRWSFEALLINQYQREGDDGEEVLEYYEFDNFKKRSAITIVLLMIVGVNLISLFALQQYKGNLQKSKVLEEAHEFTMNNENDDVVVASMEIDNIEESKLSKHQEKRLISRTMSTANNGAIDNFMSRFSTAQEYIIEDPEEFQMIDYESFRASSVGMELAEGIKVDVQGVTISNKSHSLHDISFSVQAGEMCIITGGASTEMKKALLDVVSFRRKITEDHDLYGKVLYNDIDPSLNLLDSVAFVMQSDVLIAQLTVMETLDFAARLRISSFSAEERNKKVTKVMKMMGLEKVSSVIVGNHAIRGINKVQKRRLTIAMEVLSMPGIIVLEEPTYGLDVSNSEEVIAAMKNLSNQNRTIIATVSSPPAGGYALFDVAVVLTSEGRLMYNSTAKDAVPYYIKAFGFAFDHTANPADFLLELSIEGGISKDALLVKPSDLVDHYFHTNPLLRSISINSVTSDEAKIHRYSSLSNSIYSNIGLKRISEIVTYRPISVRGFSKQIFPLLYRYSLLTYRNRTPIYLAFGRCIFMAVVTGAAFMHLPDGTSYFPYFERESFSFLCVYFTTIAQLHTIPVFFQDIEILRREVTINLYSPLAYWASTWIVYSTYYFLHSLVFACIAYYLADVSRKIEAFIIFFFALHICGQCAYFLSQYFSATSLSIASASNKFLILVFVDVLFAGYYQDILNMRSWLGSWLPYFSIMRWAYQAMVVIEFQDNSDLPDGQGYIDQLGFESVSAAGSIAILVLMLFVYLTITATVLQNRKY